MAGRPGRSGRKPLSLQEHLDRGTYRRDRHGPLSANGPVVNGTAAVHAKPVAVPAELVEGLGAAGERFMRAAFVDFEFSSLEATVLRVAAVSLDDAATARAASDGKGARAAHRQFLAALARLGLPMWDRR